MLPARFLKRLMLRLIVVFLLFSIVIFILNSLVNSDFNSKDKVDLQHIEVRSKDEGDTKHHADQNIEVAKESQNEIGAIHRNHLDSKYGKHDSENDNRADQNHKSNKEVVVESNADHGVNGEGEGDQGRKDEGFEDDLDRYSKLKNSVNSDDEMVGGAKGKQEDEDTLNKIHENEREAEKDGHGQIEAPKDNRKQESQLGPGENGEGVNIDKFKLTKVQQADYDKGWGDNAFNRYVSDMISLHRSLPDIRDPECKNLDFGDNLPDACVIIIFHNEAWSTLLRTVHSVLDRSGEQNLKQIILVDDFSEFAHLKEPLQDYVDKLDKVSLVRASERSGLIRARLMGFDRCTSQVAIFLDSHCEVTEGWLPPLLYRIKENNTNVLVPVIDVIDDDTFRYNGASGGGIRSVYVGGFDWGLLFNWHPIPDTELKRIHNKNHLPVRSPTMAGGLFAISSDYFRKLGTYDSGFDIWGGENLEISFKTWMCGGTLETIPCSHVGHVFRKRSPYKWGAKRNSLQKNLVRLAEVWLDDFKEYYYMRINNNLGDYGDVSERKAIREKLQCKSFKWYLNNIYPELYVPGNSIASGEIRNKDRSMCIDASTDSEAGRSQPVSVYPCHLQGGNQFWLLSDTDEMRRDEYCWDTPDGTQVKIYGCHGSKGHQEFIYRTDESIYNPNFQKCVQMTWDAKGLQMAICKNETRQRWQMSRSPPKGPKKE